MQSFNPWFLSLEEGRQAVLREDKWALAEAAYKAGAEQKEILMNEIMADLQLQINILQEQLANATESD